MIELTVIGMPAPQGSHIQRRDAAGKIAATHGVARHPAYISWKAMRRRCLNPNHKDYPSYGGRGIGMAPEWINNPLEFVTYVDRELGPKPAGGSIDRIDNQSGYVPGNIRWASRKQQMNNLRSNRFIEFNGRRQTLQQWADETGLSHGTIRSRLEAGRSMSEVFSRSSLRLRA